MLLTFLAASSVLTSQSVNYARAIAVSPNGQTIAVGGWSQTVEFYRPDGTYVTRLGSFSRHVTGLSWDRTGTRVAVSVADGTVGVWDLRRESWVWSKNSGTSFASGVEMLPGGDVISSGYDNRLKRWNGQNGRLMRTFTGLPSDAYGMAASFDGRTVVGFGPDGANVWDAASGRNLGNIRRNTNYGTAAFISNGQTIVLQMLDGKVSFHGMRLGEAEIREWNASSLAASPAAPFLAVGTKVGGVFWFNTVDGDTLWTNTGGSTEVTAMAVSRDGTRVWAAYQDGTVRGIRTRDGQVTATITLADN